jgi:hypothetical protein
LAKAGGQLLDPRFRVAFAGVTITRWKTQLILSQAVPVAWLLLLFFGELSAINLFFAVEILELGQSHIGKTAAWLAVFRCYRDRRSARSLEEVAGLV